MTKRSMITRFGGALVAVVAFAALQGTAVAEWDPTKVMAKEAAVAQTLVDFIGEDASMDRFFNEAEGYAVFPKIGSVAFIVGGEHGKGEVFEQGESIGIAKITALSVGASLGGQTFQEIIFFKSKTAMDKFKGNKFTFGADAAAVVASKGAAAKAVWRDDIAVFVRGNKGLMVDASVNTQRFKFEPK